MNAEEKLTVVHEHLSALEMIRLLISFLEEADALKAKDFIAYARQQAAAQRQAGQVPGMARAIGRAIDYLDPSGEAVRLN